MTELPTVAYPSHLSDGSLATDPWPGFDLHPIRSTPEGSPIGGLAQREVELGDVGRQRTHRARAASSAYSCLFPADKKKGKKKALTKACQTSFPGFIVPACANVFMCEHQSQADHTGPVKNIKATAGTVSSRSKFRAYYYFFFKKRVKTASARAKTAAVTDHNENYCGDEQKRHIMKEVLNVKLIDQSSPPSHTCPLLRRLYACARTWFNSSDMEVNPNCDSGNILLDHGNKIKLRLVTHYKYRSTFSTLHYNMGWHYSAGLLLRIHRGIKQTCKSYARA